MTVSSDDHPSSGRRIVCECGWTTLVSIYDCVAAYEGGQKSPVKVAIDAHWQEQEVPEPPDDNQTRLLRAFAAASWALGLCSGKLDHAGLFDAEVRTAVERAMACINACKEMTDG